MKLCKCMKMFTKRKRLRVCHQGTSFITGATHTIACCTAIWKKQITYNTCVKQETFQSFTLTFLSTFLI